MRQKRNTHEAWGAPREGNGDAVCGLNKRKAGCVAEPVLFVKDIKVVSGFWMVLGSKLCAFAVPQH